MLTAISAQRSAVKRPLGPVLPVRPSILRKRDIEPITSSVGLIHGIPPYQAKSGETYMNDRQLKHFRNILLAWKQELMEEVDRTVHHMQDEASNFPDPNDRATQESEFGLELRTRDRERKLLKKIDSALERIEDGSYGYCEETGEEIGLRRLEARPVATLSVEAQERREMAERQFSDREDAF
jgi:DnaK suppressor protein